MSSDTSLLSVKSLFTERAEYIIPIYQRNYAWEQHHLKQLVQDVWDSCVADITRNYYIGTLVVHRKKDGRYETIDGQQRLTTLNIMLCAMKNALENDDKPFDWFNGINISYEFREKSSSALKRLFDHVDETGIEDEAIADMYEFVKPAVDSIVGSDPDSYKMFKEYLFNKVMITRVVLPDDTDLNHYFEIMNTRGEQLEKHEILKAQLLNAVKGENREVSWIINRIWEACSNMDRYVQMCFKDVAMRRAIFSDDWNTFIPDSFESLSDSVRAFAKNEPRHLFSIADVISGGTEANNCDSGSIAGNEAERFSSVINFPNFLLHVLRVMTREDIPLDDKRLLESFKSRSIDADFTKRFIFNLLRLRFLFDKFIIKRDYIEDKDNGKWDIQEIKVQDSGNYNYAKTFADGRRNTMVQAMFHVSLPSQNYKHWLCAALLHLSEMPDGKGLYDYLTELSRTYMLDRFIPEGNKVHGYYEMIFTNGGRHVNQCPSELSLPRFDSNIDMFYFNYLDMQLWLNGIAPDFMFSARSSVEHFYPRHPMDGWNPMPEKYLHDFGNLCLISRSKNSRLSNYAPVQKAAHYKHSGIDSIKQKLMMDILEAYGTWEKKQITDHAAEMSEILRASLEK